MVSKQTTLDLNGPILSFIQQPQSTIVDDNSTITFIGIATATFPVQNPPNPSANTGTLVYRWNAEGFGPLNDGTFRGASITGTATTTLTISNVKSPDTNLSNFFLTVDYIPSAYSQPVGSAVTVGTGRSTGNAINDVLSSNNVSLSVKPFITIIEQPQDTTVAPNSKANFYVNAKLSDERFGTLSYQWQLNDKNLSDQVLVQGSQQPNLTITTSPPLIEPFLSGPVCISVIDESSPSRETIRNDWLSFRSNYPNRNFWLLLPNNGTILSPTQLKIPAEYEADPKANYSQVARDSGVTINRSDWFVICNLESYPTGTVVSLAIDSSGSMTLNTVRASYDLFKQKCAQAGLVIVETLFGDERWALPHNRALPETNPTTVGISTVRVFVSNPSAQTAISNNANLNIITPREIINFESLSDNGSFFGSGSSNLVNGSVTFTADPNDVTRSLVIYPPEKNIKVRITLAGGAGAPRGARGGEGGVSVFEYTLQQNTEYVLKLGAATRPTGGDNGGGGAAFIYEKARIIAVCGGGGGSGFSNRGGDGGGIGLGGEFGQGRNGGAGGRQISAGTLPTGSGSFPSGSFGGQLSSCTIGSSYIRSLGFSPCQDMGQRRWTGSTGTVPLQTAIIQRGYKTGLGYRNSGGNGSRREGGGGSGAYGGNAATSDGSGGGGGSGYTDGSINLISTRLGGNSSTNSYVIIEKL